MTFDTKKIEKIVMKEMRKIYSEKAIDHAMNPRNVGRLKQADGFAKITGPCGDTMEISLKISGGDITDARFWTDGCGSSIACGSVITELIKGKSISEAEKIEYTTVLEALNGLPDSDVHCSVLASKTLKAAIESCRDRRISSARIARAKWWKRKVSERKEEKKCALQLCLRPFKAS